MRIEWDEERVHQEVHASFVCEKLKREGKLVLSFFGIVRASMRAQSCGKRKSAHWK